MLIKCYPFLDYCCNSYYLITGLERIMAPMDHWCPVEYHTNIVQSVPGLKAELCKKGYAHAFVLKTSEEMAEQVCAWLQEDFSDLFS